MPIPPPPFDQPEQLAPAVRGYVEPLGPSVTLGLVLEPPCVRVPVTALRDGDRVLCILPPRALGLPVLSQSDQPGRRVTRIVERGVPRIRLAGAGFFPVTRYYPDDSVAWRLL